MAISNADIVKEIQKMRDASKVKTAATKSTGVNYINSQYDKAINNLSDKLSAAAAQSATEQNAASDNALKSAYTNYMTSKKEISGNLKKQGITGGASETTNLRADNNYQNIQSSAENARAAAINKIKSQLSSDLASGTSDLQGARAQAVASQMQTDIANAYNDKQMAMQKESQALAKRQQALDERNTLQNMYQNKYSAYSPAAAKSRMRALSNKIRQVQKKGGNVSSLSIEYYAVLNRYYEAVAEQQAMQLKRK